MTIRLFSSTDVGAPTIDVGVNGSLITVLRACLVDGYGTRTAQGWTMPFSDLPNYKAVFQSVSGNAIIRMENPDYRYAHINGYASMTDVDTGLEPYPDNAVDRNSVGNLWRTGVRQATDSQFDRWYVIADDEWFYFYQRQNITSPVDPHGFFFGEYDCVDPTFTGRYCITGYWTTPTSTSASSVENGLFNSGMEMWGMRDFRNEVGKRVEMRRDRIIPDYTFPNRISGGLVFEKLNRLRSDGSGEQDYYGSLPAHITGLADNNRNYRGGELLTIGGQTYVLMVDHSEINAIRYDVNSG